MSNLGGAKRNYKNAVRFSERSEDKEPEATKSRPVEFDYYPLFLILRLKSDDILIIYNHRAIEYNRC